MLLLKILFFVIGLSILILFHEFGHFITAKIFKVYVYEFSLFMGPKLFQFKKGETKYTLRLLPIGGYCSLAGEEDAQSERNEKEEKDEDRPEVPLERTMLGIKNWKKVIIMGAGAFINIILSWIFLFFFAMFYWKYGFGDCIRYAFQCQWYFATAIFEALGQLVVGKGWDQMAGVVGMFTVSETFMNNGFWEFVYFLAFISVNLGIMNLLPFPALDGGRILLTIIESITKKKTPKKVEEILNLVGFCLLMALMLFVTVQDIARLINK